MKLLIVVGLGALLIGTVYHKEISRAFTQTASRQSSGVMDSMGSLGNSVGRTMGGIGGSFGQ